MEPPSPGSVLEDLDDALESMTGLRVGIREPQPTLFHFLGGGDEQSVYVYIYIYIYILRPKQTIP